MKRKRSKDWNREWGMPETEVQDMLDSFRKMQECEHEWKPMDEDSPDRALFSEAAEECAKCGGAQVTVSEKEFREFKKVLEHGKD